MGEIRKHWTPDQKAKVLAEAGRILATEGELARKSMARLITRAQMVLDADERRNWNQYAFIKSNAWFHDHLEEAITAAKGQPTQQPETELPIAELPVDTLTMFQTATQAMNEIAQAVQGSNAVLTDLAPRLAAVEAELKGLAERFDNLLNHGMVAVLTPAYKGIPTGLTITPSPQQPTATEPPKPPPSQPEKQWRKPRVMVLNVDSGSTKDGIKKGIQGFFEVLSFDNVGQTKVPTFENYDWVVATKWVPTAWIALAKETSPALKTKIKVAPGNAMKIAAFLRTHCANEIEVPTDGFQK